MIATMGGDATMEKGTQRIATTLKHGAPRGHLIVEAARW
jgi:hypothetical protein